MTALNISWSEAWELPWRQFRYLCDKLGELRDSEVSELRRVNGKAQMG